MSISIPLLPWLFFPDPEWYCRFDPFWKNSPSTGNAAGLGDQDGSLNTMDLSAISEGRFDPHAVNLSIK
jgi:hypothetical protein